MAVEIKEVVNKKDLKKWVDFPNKLYKKVPAYVPFLRADEISTFTKEENVAYDFCETRLFLAYKDNKIVGRICALINHAANKKWGTSNIRFTRFDFIDDYEVSSALFDEVIKWGKERGFNKVIGPIGFTDMDHEGMLIEGFDKLNMSITFYNHPYYLNHYTRLGLEKEVDWVEYLLTVPENYSEKHTKISEYLQRKYGYKLVTYNTFKSLKNDAYEAFKVIDESFSKLYGTVPLTDRVIDRTIKDNLSLMNLKYICSVRDKNDAIIGFAVLVPSIAKALKKSNGKILPFGIFRLLKALRGKNDRLEMFFIAVKPEYQNKGVPAIIVDHMIRTLIENGVKYCESGPELELNKEVQSIWKHFDVENHKRRRCFKKEI
ncbi:MAG: GNAT family N-acetyltransferase [Clostridiales bacterium]|nr:GNAT family N-acetyltransferase [Clostridiales bacterium]